MSARAFTLAVLLLASTPAFAQLGGGSSSSSGSTTGSISSQPSAASPSPTATPASPPTTPLTSPNGPGAAGAPVAGGGANVGALETPRSPPAQTPVQDGARSQGANPSLPQGQTPIASAPAGRGATSARCKAILQDTAAHSAAEVSLCRQHETADQRIDQLEDASKRAVRSICPSC